MGAIGRRSIRPTGCWAHGEGPVERARSQVTKQDHVNSGAIVVGPTERGLWFQGGQFQEMLGPGTYRLPSVGWDPARDYVEIVDTRQTRFENPRLDELLSDDLLRQSLLVVEVRPSEQAVVWKGDQPGWVIGPGRHAFWRHPAPLRVTFRHAPAAQPG